MSNVAGRVPATAVRLPRADLERIIALRPDLVVVSEYTDADFLRLVEKSGLRYHRMSGLDTLAGIRAAILDLGRAVGDARRRRAPRRRASTPCWPSSRGGSRETRGRASSTGPTRTPPAPDTAIGVADRGGRRRRTSAASWASRASCRSPGRARSPPTPTPSSSTQGSGASVALRRHPLLSRTRAVREGRVVEMPNRLLVALSDRAADAAWWLASRLHPARVPEAAPPPKLP